MSRYFAFLIFLVSIPNVNAKCPAPDLHKLSWIRVLSPKSIPSGIEVFDRVWLKNPTEKEFITYTPEKGAEKRTGYREKLGNVPTSNDELPGTKLVNGERYEFHFPANPDYSSGEGVQQSGWVKQDYPAGLVEPRTPVIPEKIVERIFLGKLDRLVVKVPVHYYYGKKRGTIDCVYEFKKNPNYGVVDPKCK
jgi:hypothetical protein